MTFLGWWNDPRSKGYYSPGVWFSHPKKGKYLGPSFREPIMAPLGVRIRKKKLRGIRSFEDFLWLIFFGNPKIGAFSSKKTPRNTNQKACGQGGWRHLSGQDIVRPRFCFWQKMGQHIARVLVLKRQIIRTDVTDVWANIVHICIIWIISQLYNNYLYILYNSRHPSMTWLWNKFHAHASTSIFHLS